MNIVEAIILAIIQGITEWFPISSSGHLVIGEKLLNLETNLPYDILLHIGSLVVVLFVFRKDILGLIKVLIGKGTNEYKTLSLHLILGSIPIIIFGFFFQNIVKSTFSSLPSVGILLLITGLFLFLSKRKTRKRILSSKNVILIGLAQSIAVLPGISRSGITISTAVMSGIDREKAARFSFLLFIPAIVGALILNFKDFQLENNLEIMLLGTLVTIIVSYFALTLLLRLIKQKKFYLFAYYCWIVGIIIILMSIKNGL